MKIGDKVRVISYGSLIYCSRFDWLMLDRYNRKYQKEFDNMMWNIKEEVELPSVNLSSKPPSLYKEVGDIYLIDLDKSLIGQRGIIDGISFDEKRYSICGIKGKHAWYNEDQLELINENMQKR